MNAFFRRRVGRVLPLAIIPLFLAGLVQAEGTATLVIDRCQGCHGLDKTCAVQADDAQWWNSTVARMVEYKDGLLSPDETAAVSRFLADTKKRAAVCATP